MQSLKEQGARIDQFGVGTKMITSHNTPSLGGVYKLCNLCVNGVNYPKMKISDNPVKVTNPGVKTVYRLFDKQTDKAIADLMCLSDEIIDESRPLTLTHPVERWKSKVVTDFYAKELYVDVFVEGRKTYKAQSVYDLQARCKAELDGFWDEYKRLQKPHQYKVDLSDKLYELKQRLIVEEKKGERNGI